MFKKILMIVAVLIFNETSCMYTVKSEDYTKVLMRTTETTSLIAKDELRYEELPDYQFGKLVGYRSLNSLCFFMCIIFTIGMQYGDTKCINNWIAPALLCALPLLFDGLIKLVEKVS